MRRFRRVMACTDFSDAGNRAVSYAFGLANEGTTKVTVVHVMDPPVAPNPLYAHYETETPEQREANRKRALDALEELVPKAFRDEGMPHECCVFEGSPVHEIVEHAKAQEVEVIVLGTHGHSGLKHLLIGSIAERVVRHAQCAVLVTH